MIDEIGIDEDFDEHVFYFFMFAFLDLLDEELSIDSSADFVYSVHRAVAEDLEDTHTKSIDVRDVRIVFLDAILDLLLFLW